MHMHFVKGTPPEPQHATYTGVHAKRPEVALGSPGLEYGRLDACLAEFKGIPTPHIATGMSKQSQ
jgi:hypothetical protein